MNKLSVLKKCLNKRYIIIENQNYENLFEGEAIAIVNETTLRLKLKEDKQKDVSIFDLRNPYQPY